MQRVVSSYATRGFFLCNARSVAWYRRIDGPPLPYGPPPCGTVSYPQAAVLPTPPTTGRALGGQVTKSDHRTLGLSVVIRKRLADDPSPGEAPTPKRPKSILKQSPSGSNPSPGGGCVSDHGEGGGVLSDGDRASSLAAVVRRLTASLAKVTERAPTRTPYVSPLTPSCDPHASQG
eukprot:1192063-Prorocentrum_minimum.AAC.4